MTKLLTDEQKDAKKEYMRSWYLSNREKPVDPEKKAARKEAQRVSDKARYDADPERMRERSRARHAANPDYSKNWYLANSEKHAATCKAWNEANTERIRKASKAWYEANTERVSETGKVWRLANPDKVAAKMAKRRAAKLQATPAWANDFILAEAYELSQLRTKVTGVAHHVDHIVPLSGKTVCGLHCEFNVRVIPGKENLRKSNSHWPDMP